MKAMLAFVWRLIWKGKVSKPSPEEVVVAAHKQVCKRIKGRCSVARIAQAQARAERLIAMGLPTDQAVHRAVAWAVYAADAWPMPRQKADA
jgi:hypothetical protein